MPDVGRARTVLVEFAPSGGLFQFAVQLGEGLARCGHDVRVVTGPRPELAARQQGCRVLGILPTWHPTAGADAAPWWRRMRRALRAGLYVFAWLRLLIWLCRVRPDAVVWSAWRFPVDAWGVRGARRMLPGTTLALVAHEPRPLVEQPGADGLYKTGGMLTRALAKAYPCLDAVFVLGEDARKVLVGQWPLRCAVTVIPHGNEDIFTSGAALPVAATAPHVLFFGTITAYKGLDDLLAAWPAVRAAMPAAELVVAGTIGADVDAHALVARVAALSGATLRPGYVPIGQVSALFDRARVVALPYRRSSQSGVAHLAFSFGRPVVATAVGDIPAVVREAVTGYLVPAGDPHRLADSLIRVLRDPRLADRLGAAGRSSLDNGADWDRVARAVDAALVRTGGAAARACGSNASDRPTSGTVGAAGARR